MTIAQTTVRYYDAKGIYREARFHNQKDLDTFIQRLDNARGRIIEVVR